MSVSAVSSALLNQPVTSNPTQPPAQATPQTTSSQAASAQPTTTAQVVAQASKQADAMHGHHHGSGGHTYSASGTQNTPTASATSNFINETA